MGMACATCFWLRGSIKRCTPVGCIAVFDVLTHPYYFHATALLEARAGFALLLAGKILRNTK
jgi:hypothetical protein